MSECVAKLESVKKLEDLKLDIKKIQNDLYNKEYEQLQKNVLSNVRKEFEEFCVKKGFIDCIDEERSTLDEIISGICDKSYTYKYNDILLSIKFKHNINQKDEEEGDNSLYKEILLTRKNGNTSIEYKIKVINKQLDNIPQGEILESSDVNIVQQNVDVAKNNLLNLKRCKDYEEFDFKYKIICNEWCDNKFQNIELGTFTEILKSIF